MQSKWIRTRFKMGEKEVTGITNGNFGITTDDGVGNGYFTLVFLKTGQPILTGVRTFYSAGHRVSVDVSGFKLEHMKYLAQRLEEYVGKPDELAKIIDFLSDENPDTSNVLSIKSLSNIDEWISAALGNSDDDDDDPFLSYSRDSRLKLAESSWWTDSKKEENKYQFYVVAEYPSYEYMIEQAKELRLPEGKFYLYDSHSKEFIDSNYNTVVPKDVLFHVWHSPDSLPYDNLLPQGIQQLMAEYEIKDFENRPRSVLKFLEEELGRDLGRVAYLYTKMYVYSNLRKNFDIVIEPGVDASVSVNGKHKTFNNLKESSSPQERYYYWSSRDRHELKPGTIINRWNPTVETHGEDWVELEKIFELVRMKVAPEKVSRIGCTFACNVPLGFASKGRVYVIKSSAVADSANSEMWTEARFKPRYAESYAESYWTRSKVPLLFLEEMLIGGDAEVVQELSEGVVRKAKALYEKMQIEEENRGDADKIFREICRDPKILLTKVAEMTLDDEEGENSQWLEEADAGESLPLTEFSKSEINHFGQNVVDFIHDVERKYYAGLSKGKVKGVSKSASDVTMFLKTLPFKGYGIKWRGGGAFRNVFAFDNDYIVKVACNTNWFDNARMMNKKESEVLNSDATGMHPRIYKSSKDGLWQIQEKVEVIKNWDKFMEFFPNFIDGFYRLKKKLRSLNKNFYNYEVVIYHDMYSVFSDILWIIDNSKSIEDASNKSGLGKEWFSILPMNPTPEDKKKMKVLKKNGVLETLADEFIGTYLKNADDVFIKMYRSAKTSKYHFSLADIRPDNVGVNEKGEFIIIDAGFEFNEMRKGVKEAQRYKKEVGTKFDPLDKLKPHINDYYVLFHKTDIEKFGINPRSEFSTPLGIYTYPLTKEFYIALKKGSGLPFRDKAPIAQVVKVKDQYKDNIVVLNRRGEQIAGKVLDAEEELKRQVIASRTHPRTRLDIDGYIKYRYHGDPEDMDAVLDGYFKDWYDTVVLSNARTKTNFGILWFGLGVLAGYLENPDNASIQWRKNLVNAGIYGVIDLGSGIIHKNEPTQAVVFSKNIVEPLLAYTEFGKTATAKRTFKTSKLDADKFFAKINASQLSSFLQKTPDIILEFESDEQFNSQVKSLCNKYRDVFLEELKEMNQRVYRLSDALRQDYYGYNGSLNKMMYEVFYACYSTLIKDPDFLKEAASTILEELNDLKTMPSNTKSVLALIFNTLGFDSDTSKDMIRNYAEFIMATGADIPAPIGSQDIGLFLDIDKYHFEDLSGLISQEQYKEVEQYFSRGPYFIKSIVYEKFDRLSVLIDQKKFSLDQVRKQLSLIYYFTPLEWVGVNTNSFMKSVYAKDLDRILKMSSEDKKLNDLTNKVIDRLSKNSDGWRLSSVKDNDPGLFESQKVTKQDLEKFLNEDIEGLVNEIYTTGLARQPFTFDEILESMIEEELDRLIK